MNLIAHVFLTCIIDCGILVLSTASSDKLAEAAKPHLIQLRRELYPVRRGGKVVSHKASYSGHVRLGSFYRVVFDTGSGHIIVPSVQCTTPTCLKHKRYDIRASPTATAIQSNGDAVLPGERVDQVTIGFGTGRVTGEFVRDAVCIGSPPSADAADKNISLSCITAQIVTAIDMSRQPFQFFDFDGIVGLGLPSLSLAANFSFFDLFSRSKHLGSRQFAVFLTDGENGEESELALGGYNPQRFEGDLSWAPIVQPKLGHWLVEIVAVRVGGKKLDICHDSMCKGILDTGTSHIGIPASHYSQVADLLTHKAGTLEDCRQSEAPVLELEMKGFRLTLYPDSYMRKLPLSKAIDVESKGGVSPTSHLRDMRKSNDTNATVNKTAADTTGAEKMCKPKLMPVSMPKPLGPNLFILGEPLLQRYYTVFDWTSPSAGFAVAARASANAHSAQKKDLASSSVQNAPAAASPPPEQVMQNDAPIFLAQVNTSEVTKTHLREEL